jgi:hypothetical protein
MLLRNLCEELFLRLVREMDKTSNSASSPLESLRRGMKAYINFGLRHPSHYRLVFMSPELYQDSEMSFQFEGSTGERAFRFLTQAIQKAIEHGDLQRGDVMRMAQTAWVSIHGVTSLLITKPKFP